MAGSVAGAGAAGPARGVRRPQRGRPGGVQDRGGAGRRGSARTELSPAPAGQAEKSREEELFAAALGGAPLLVVQGAHDPFGRPEEFPGGYEPDVVVPYGDHGFAVPKRAPLAQEEALKIITDGVVGWAASLG